MSVENQDVLTEIFARATVVQRRAVELLQLLERSDASLDAVRDAVSKLCAYSSDMERLVNGLESAHRSVRVIGRNE